MRLASHLHPIIKLDGAPRAKASGRVHLVKHSYWVYAQISAHTRIRIMQLLPLVIAGLLGILHLYILILEMFLWTSPYGHRAFAMTAAQAEATRVLAANQGLYNGFLAAGLIWGLWPQPEQRLILGFFFGCVFLAGVYGAATANRRILFIQALPGLAGLISLIRY